MDSAANCHFYSRMWRTLLVFFLGASAAVAQQSTAYDALKAVGSQLGRPFLNRVISVTGTDGDPQPVQWQILLADPGAAGGVREVQISNGRVISEQTPMDRSPGTTIKTGRLNLDSSGAFSVASYTAEQSHVNFALARYVLSNSKHGEPTWIVTLLDERRQPIGTIHIGANKGTVTRVEGLYRGRNIDPAQEEVLASRRDTRMERRPPENRQLSAEDDVVSDEDDDENFVKREFKQMFQRTKRDAAGIFGRVRRSFDDFVQRR